MGIQRVTRLGFRDYGSTTGIQRVGRTIFSQWPASAGAGTWKTTNGLAVASIKTVNDLALASIKAYDGLKP